VTHGESPSIDKEELLVWIAVLERALVQAIRYRQLTETIKEELTKLSIEGINLGGPNVRWGCRCHARSSRDQMGMLFSQALSWLSTHNELLKETEYGQDLGVEALEGGHIDRINAEHRKYFY
jgi:hypothetical protein